MVEIERKFLVRSNDFKKEAFTSFRIVQGFLSRDPERTVRVRLTDEQGFVTIKGPSSDDGLERYEWEQEISKDDAERLLHLCLPGTIDKIRYLITVDDKVFEVDEFHGDNEGLIVAELELLNQNDTYTPPKWLGKEVTGESKYYNSQLSDKPYKTWNK